MFNGIIFNKGKISRIKKRTKGINLFIKSSLNLSNKNLGISISCDGVCLTLISYKKKILVSPDKSLSIRSILLASQAIGISTITNLLESEDVLNAIKAIQKLGIECKKKSGKYIISGFGLNGFDIKKNTTIDAGNSGTLARLLLGLLVKVEKKVKIVGDKSLSKRDFSRVTEQIGRAHV